MATDPKSPGSVAISVFRGYASNTWSRISWKTKPRDQEEVKDMSALTVRNETLPELPCHVGEPDLWFAENPGDLQRAKVLCEDCPIRRQCLAAALDRQEPWGGWGGEIFDRGAIVERKRPRGRPRKDAVAA
jgi:WhiB family redox-sensing transcriptional regulator